MFGGRKAGRGHERAPWSISIGEAGRFVGMNSFGASAPFERLYKEFGITPEAVAAAAREALAAARP